VSDELDRLRAEIDRVDGGLIEILADRARLTERVGETKRELGLPLYVPEREAALFGERRRRARERGLDPDLVEDLLRRMIRDSYSAQENRFPATGDPERPVVVVGGAGALGRCLGGLFRRSGYTVRDLEKGDWSRASEVCDGAQLVLVSVPIDRTVGVVGDLPPLPGDCVLADVTSVKSEPLRAMLDAHAGPVVGLHPMFGLDVRSLAKQVVVVCEGRSSDRCRWLLDQFVLWGAALREETPAGHDRAMATVQAMRHFTTLVYGAFLEEIDADLDELLRLSSPIYRLELGMVGRLFAQNPELYTDIMLSSAELPELAATYRQVFDEVSADLEDERRERVIERFEGVQRHFGERAERLFHECGDLLRKAHDARDPSTG